MSSVSALNSLLSGSSSINLSDILEAALGASSPGIDVNAAVSSSLSAAEEPEQAWENQQTTLQNQSNALSQLQSDAGNLDSDMQALNSLTGPLSATTVTSSNPSILTASSASGTTLGNNVVVGNSLASTASWASGSYTSGSSALPAGSFTITTAGGATATITTDGTTTLNAVATQINGDGLGVTASVIADATGSRLAIVSNTSGSAANFTITSPQLAGYGFTQAGVGANASLTVDGISISSATNTVTGAIPGLTLNLLGSNPAAQVTLSVTPDGSQASSAINQFVSDYNTLLQAVNAQYTDTGSGEGVLASDPTVNSLQPALLQATDYTYQPSSGTASLPNLSSLGITVNSNGTLSVDSGTLNNALQNNFSGVQNFFQGSALNGFANALDQQLTNFTSPADGAFTVDLKSISSENTDLQNDIDNFQQNVITPLKAQLTSEYSNAEIALQQLPGELKNIDAELGLNSSSSSNG